METLHSAILVLYYSVSFTYYVTILIEHGKKNRH